MKKVLVIITLLSFHIGIGCSVFVYFYPSAHENWAQPSTNALTVEPDENYMKVKREGLVMIVRSLAEGYDNLKNSSNARIDELKFTLMALVILLSVSVGLIFSLLFQVKKQHVTRV